MTNDALDASHDGNLAIAEAIAATWSRRRADIEQVAAPLRAWMLRELRPQPGDTVLELAAGVGDTGFEAAAKVGEHGRLICSDFSPTMLDAARQRGAELGITNADYRVIDAQRIDLDSDSVDGVLCRLGYMLMADPAAALRETRRVLRTGGRLALGVWGSPDRNPFFTIVANSLVQRGHIPPPEPPPAPGIFAMASTERTTTLLRAAGFGAMHTEEVVGRFVLPDPDAYLSMIADTAGPIALALRRLDESERTDVRSAVADSLEAFTAESGYELPCVALCAVAS